MRWTPIAAMLVLAACDCEDAQTAGPEPEPASEPATATREDYVGRYRAVLGSPGGELPFFMTIHEEGADPPAEMHNGEENAPFSGVEIDGDEILLDIAHYGAFIEATRRADGTLRGRWQRDNREGVSELSFVASPVTGETPRFTAPIEEPGADTIEDVSGSYRLTITDDDGPYPALAVLRADGDDVSGSVLTAVGDYRYLTGDFREGVLRLSTFNGFFSYLVVARANEAGGLTGDIWSRDTYHATFEGTPVEGDEEVLPDPYGETRVVSEDQKLRLEAETIDGEPIALPSEALDGRVVIVDIFGTWCPNCTDETPLLASLYSRYRERGLTVIGLAFEYRADPDVAIPRLRDYRERHGVEFPVVLAGRASSAVVAEVLPDLSELKSYPTTIFIGRDGRVRRIHTGFAGPATGEHHEELVAEFEELVEALISEES